MNVNTDIKLSASSETKPWLVLGHSLGTSSSLWSLVDEHIADQANLCLVDFPGHGRASAAAGPFSISDLADLIVYRLEENGIKSFYYAGVSLGGVVALDLALRYSEKVRGVCVMSAGVAVVNPDMWMDRADFVRVYGTDALVEGAFTRWFSPYTQVNSEVRAKSLLNDLSSTDDQSYAYACEALAEYNARERLGSIRVPTIAAGGESDQLVPVVESRKIAEGVQGELVVINDAAHASPIEQPEQVSRVIKRLIKM